MKRIDARGLACPQPMMLIRKAVQENPEGAEILVDDVCAVENIGRFAANMEYSMEKQSEGEATLLTLVKK